MKEILLTKGMVAIVDDEDYKWVSEWKWHVYENRGNYYAARRKRGVRTIGRSTIFMHREIVIRNFGKIDDGMHTDHANGNGLDNRKSNLRICTPAQNQYNSRVRAGGTSKYKGVLWRRERGKWISVLRISGKHIHLGTFTNEIDAAIAYDSAAIKYFGEFARTNFDIKQYLEKTNG